MLSFIKEELKEKAKIEDEKKDEEKEDPKGIPEFWLTVFKNVDLLSDMVQVILFMITPVYFWSVNGCDDTSLSVIDLYGMVVVFWNLCYL